jgi:hypothetical protein
VAGELPLEHSSNSEVLFAGFGTPDARFVTIDYGEPVPLVSPGQAVEFGALKQRRTSDAAILDRRRASETPDLRNLLEC